MGDPTPPYDRLLLDIVGRATPFNRILHRCSQRQTGCSCIGARCPAIGTLPPHCLQLEAAEKIT
eukprot:5286197-Prorocentrum_lima.AAC.1